MTYILRNWGSFLNIPVASNTVNSLLLRRLENENKKGDESFLIGSKGLACIHYTVKVLFSDNLEIQHRYNWEFIKHSYVFTISSKLKK